MTMTRVIAAFLFAVVLAFFALVMFWNNAMQRAEKQLEVTLAQVFGEGLAYGLVQWHYNPFEARFTIHNVEFWVHDKATDARYLHKMKRVDVSRELMGEGRINVLLPQQHEIETGIGADLIQYDARIQDGMVSIYPEVNGGELYTSARTVYINEVGSDNHFNSRGAYFFKAGSGNHYDMRISLQDMTSSGLFGVKDTFHADALVVDLGLQKVPDYGSKMILPVVATQSLDVFKAGVVDVLEAMRSQDGHITLKDILYEKGDYWIGLNGKVQLDRRDRPAGEVNLSTNKADRTLAFFREKGLLDDTLMAKNRVLYRVINQSDNSLDLNMKLNHGSVSISGVEAGFVPTITDFLSMQENE